LRSGVAKFFCSKEGGGFNDFKYIFPYEEKKIKKLCKKMFKTRFLGYIYFVRQNSCPARDRKIKKNIEMIRRKIMKSTSANIAIRKPILSKAIAFVVALALIAGLMPFMPGSDVYGLNSNYSSTNGYTYTWEKNDIVLTKAESEKAPILQTNPLFTTSGGFISKIGNINETIYIPGLDVWRYATAAEKTAYISEAAISVGDPKKKASGLVSAFLPDTAEIELGDSPNYVSIGGVVYVHVYDPTQPPHAKQYSKQTTNPGIYWDGDFMQPAYAKNASGTAILNKDGSKQWLTPVEPVSFTIKDVDPTSGYDLQTSIHYTPAYGQLLFEQLNYYLEMKDDFDKERADLVKEIAKTTDAKKKAELQETLDKMDEEMAELEKGIGFYVNMFDSMYPLIAPNLGSMTVEGALDKDVLDNIPNIIEYLAADSAKNFTEFNIVSTVEIPSGAAASWDADKLSNRTKNAMKLLDITVTTPKPNAESAALTAAIAKLSPKKLTEKDSSGKQKDNEVVVSNPDGSSTTNNPDGSKTTVYPDGSKETVAKDGTKTIVTKDGTTTIIYKDGTSKVTLKDGTVTTIAKDGTITNPKTGELIGNSVATQKVVSLKTAVKTIYVKKGKTVKIPYVAYAKTGFKGQKVSLVWTASKPKIASVKLKAKQGSLVSGKLDGKSALKIKAGKKTGTSKVTIKANNGNKLVITIKVVKSVKKVAKFNVGKIKSLKHGKTKFIKVSKITKKATGGVATFTIAKKYKKYLAVDAAGKLTAKKAYKKGKKAIPVKVKVGTKTKTIKVKVK
jgi:hypothetical protein